MRIMEGGGVGRNPIRAKSRPSLFNPVSGESFGQTAKGQGLWYLDPG